MKQVIIILLIATALAKINPDAAQRYLDLAPVREKIDREAQDATDAKSGI